MFPGGCFRRICKIHELYRVGALKYVVQFSFTGAMRMQSVLRCNTPCNVCLLDLLAFSAFVHNESSVATVVSVGDRRGSFRKPSRPKRNCTKQPVLLWDEHLTVLSPI